MDNLAQPKPEPLTTAPPFLQWGLLTACSALLATLLELASLPAALLIGPMMAAILRHLRRHRAGAAAAVCRRSGDRRLLIAASISSDIFLSFSAEWPLFLAAVLATVAASSLLGWLISRWRILPGTTGVWGSSPAPRPPWC